MMNLKKMVDVLKLEVLSGSEYLEEKAISGGYCSDMLSDVMGNAREGNVWITLQTHRNVMAVAALKELSAIIVVRDLRPEEEMLALGGKEGIPVLGTSLSAFEIAGSLYSLLQKG